MGLGAAAEYLTGIGMDEIEAHDRLLNKKATLALKKLGAEILGPENPEERGGILSFNLQGIDHHSIAIMLNESANIMIRAGRHCVHSWFNSRNIPGSARASFYLYNTEAEADSFAEEIEKIAQVAK